jgi:hypothetical protein
MIDAASATDFLSGTSLGASTASMLQSTTKEGRLCNHRRPFINPAGLKIRLAGLGASILQNERKN